MKLGKFARTFFWQCNLPRADALLWTVIVLFLTGYGIGMILYLGYSPWLCLAAPILMQGLFAWHHRLLRRVKAHDGADAVVKSLVPFPRFEDMYDLRNVVFLPGGYLPAAE